MNAGGADQLDAALAMLGALILLLSPGARILAERFWVTGPMVVLAVGVGVGPLGAGLFRPPWLQGGKAVFEEVLRIALALQIVGIGVRVPAGYVLREWRSLAVLLGLGMPAMWVASGALCWLVVGLPLTVAALVGAVLAPTDPILASSIVTGRVAERNVPPRLRDLLSTESAANDGLAYPIVLLPVLVLEPHRGGVLGHWLGVSLVWDVGVAALVGALLGWLASHLRAWVKRTDRRQTLFAYTVGLALAALGIAKLLGTDGIFAAFTAAATFGLDIEDQEWEELSDVQETFDRFFNIYVFAVLGVLLPWDGWVALGWRGPAFAAAVLLLRRLPALLAMRGLIPAIHDTREAGLLGWFGPMGAAALFYAILAERRTGDPTVWPLVTLVVCASVVVHGLTATPFTRLHGRRAGSGGRGE